MKFYKKNFIPIILIMLQPVFLQSVPEETHERLVETYKRNDNDRSKYSNWYHRILNNKNYTAAKEAQKHLDDQNVASLKDNDEDRQKVLNQKKWWHKGFFKPENIALAERAQKEIDEVNQKPAKDIIESDFKYISDKRLSEYSTNDLVVLADLFKNTSIPQRLSDIIGEKFAKDPQIFPNDGVKYLTLTLDIVNKLEKAGKLKPNIVRENQRNQFLNNKQIELSQFKMNVLVSLANLFEKNEPLPENLLTTIHDKFNDEIKERQFIKENQYIINTINTKGIISELHKQRKEISLGIYIADLQSKVDAVRRNIKKKEAKEEDNEVDQKSVENITKNEFQYITNQRLAEYSIEDLIDLTNLFNSDEELPERLLNEINQKAILSLSRTIKSAIARGLINTKAIIAKLHKIGKLNNLENIKNEIKEKFRTSKQADEEAEVERRAAQEAEAKARAEEEARAQKERSKNAQAETKKEKQTQVETETQRKVAEIERRKLAEIEAKIEKQKQIAAERKRKAAEFARYKASVTQGEAKYTGQKTLEEYFNRFNLQDYENLDLALRIVGFQGNALDENEWKKFYKSKALFFHPDRPTADENKMKELTIANDYLKEYYSSIRS